MTQPDTAILLAASAAWLEAATAGEPAASASAVDPLPVSSDARSQADARQVAVLRLINAYRYLGVRAADLDPLRRMDNPPPEELDPAHYGLGSDDLPCEFDTGSLAGPARDTLAGILQRLRRTYCGRLGIEYMHISDAGRKRWLQQRIECDTPPAAEAGQRRQWLRWLTEAEVLEQFIHTRYVGQKRFSLEGAETLMPMLHWLMRCASEQGVQEVVMGMAHRGRINVLVNLLGKPLHALFGVGRLDNHRALDGDVRYHQGFSAELATPAGRLHLALAFNPSHLEIVHPVVRGSVRARQHRRGDADGVEVMPLLIHGDAAFSGQGVVMESFNMAETRGYDTGGAIHIVVNNQIGFTTSDPRDTRSSLYCTDVAKMIEAPVLHVNGDDPEAALRAVEIALEYRRAFRKNIIIDLVCFRRHGHNEQDEPAVTQPLMYQRIALHPGTRTLYARALEVQGVIGAHEARELADLCRERLDGEEPLVRPAESLFSRSFSARWQAYHRSDWRQPVDTAVPPGRLRELGEILCRVPPGFVAHERLQRILADRTAMLAGELPLDWGLAENLAYASLLRDGYPVRLSGQDSGRGTFFHRHAVWHDQARERRDAGEYVPLQHIYPNQPHFIVVDSLLSELAVLAFEYGYASAEPDELVIWEAQFGDFANGAQVVIDQFIASGESKWGRLCGLTLFLPHGQEGQGPEHSSARPERYLQLCAQDNMQVCQPTTAAQMFHLLRRQMLRVYRKPLIVLTPKSLLRARAASVPLSALTSGQFEPVLGDDAVPDTAHVTRVLLCSGKVYYDLLGSRDERGRTDTALVRVEQLYPFPDEELRAVLAAYPGLAECVWVQEEPRNQGAWPELEWRLRALLSPGCRLRLASRPESPVPAAGYPDVYQTSRQALIDEAWS